MSWHRGIKLYIKNIFKWMHELLNILSSLRFWSYWFLWSLCGFMQYTRQIHDVLYRSIDVWTLWTVRFLWFYHLCMFLRLIHLYSETECFNTMNKFQVNSVNITNAGCFWNFVYSTVYRFYQGISIPLICTLFHMCRSMSQSC